MKSIDISTKKHPNTFVIVDDADFEWFNQWKWHLGSHGYAVRNAKNKSGTILMHRELLRPPRGMFTDHTNGNRLDNQRANLRIATPAQNTRNTKKHVSGITSRFRGVCAASRGSRFRSQININNQYIHLGFFDTEVDAAAAYNEAAKKYHREFARLNEIPNQITKAVAP